MRTKKGRNALIFNSYKCVLFLIHIVIFFSAPGANTIVRAYSSQSSSKIKKNKDSAPSINPDVQGLSENCVKVPNCPVGPGASKDKEYKNPEYFCYTIDSFAEAEVEIAKYRLPAPSNKVKFNK